MGLKAWWAVLCRCPCRSTRLKTLELQGPAYPCGLSFFFFFWVLFLFTASQILEYWLSLWTDCDRCTCRKKLVMRSFICHYFHVQSPLKLMQKQLAAFFNVLPPPHGAVDKAVNWGVCVPSVFDEHSRSVSGTICPRLHSGIFWKIFLTMKVLVPRFQIMIFRFEIELFRFEIVLFRLSEHSFHIPDRAFQISYCAFQISNNALISVPSTQVLQDILLRGHRLVSCLTSEQLLFRIHWCPPQASDF